MTKTSIKWDDPKFIGFVAWLNTSQGIILTNKNTFKLSSDDKGTFNNSVNTQKILRYARIYYTDPKHTKSINNVTPLEDDYLTWWYAGQELWSQITKAHKTNTDTEQHYFGGLT